MATFFTGDELGNIKAIRCSRTDPKSWTLVANTVHTNPFNDKSNAIQKLSFHSNEERAVLATASADGSLSALSVTSDSKLDVIHQWKDPRFKPSHTHVGLTASTRGLYWCTSNGALGHSPIPDPTGDESTNSGIRRSTLPMRLSDWRLSPQADAFAYGGEDVELSIWDIERAFAKSSQSAGAAAAEKKRKREGDLLPAETWRARNVPNDGLSLRQPVHNTSLTYIQPSGSQNHIVAGTQHGHVRRYDTRAARRPIADWRDAMKVGGVKFVEAGLHEHELFVADQGCTLSALDLRNGRTVYSYKKIAGAVTSSAPSSHQLLGSTSRDRFFRLHSTFPPPEREGGQQDQKGEVLGSLYMKSTPTAVIFDTRDVGKGSSAQNEEGDEDEDVWAGMQVVDEEEDDEDDRTKRQRKKSR